MMLPIVPSDADDAVILWGVLHVAPPSVVRER